MEGWKEAVFLPNHKIGNTQYIVEEAWSDGFSAWLKYGFLHCMQTTHFTQPTILWFMSSIQMRLMTDVRISFADVTGKQPDASERHHTTEIMLCGRISSVDIFVLPATSTNVIY